MILYFVEEYILNTTNKIRKEKNKSGKNFEIGKSTNIVEIFMKYILELSASI